MKITNIDKFRKELYKSIKCVAPLNLNVTECSKTLYTDEVLTAENKELKFVIRSLDHPLALARFHYDSNIVRNRVTDAVMYITVEEDGVSFYTCNREKQCFDYRTSRYFSDYGNKTEFAMMVAVMITEFSKE